MDTVPIALIRAIGRLAPMPNKSFETDPLQQAFYMLLRIFANKNRTITGQLSQR